MTTVLAAGAVLESDLLRFWIALALLLTSAKVLGHLAKRLGQPTVVGELSAGILLGPTLLGRVFPQVTEQLFPDEGTVAIMIAAVAWLGVVLLLAATGFTSGQYSPVRQELLDSGLVFVPARGRLAFSVPGFADWIDRNGADQ